MYPMRDIAKIRYSLFRLSCITYDGKQHTAWEETLCSICVVVAGVTSLLIRTCVYIDLPWLYNNQLFDFLGVVVMYTILYVITNWITYIFLNHKLSHR